MNDRQKFAILLIRLAGAALIARVFPSVILLVIFPGSSVVDRQYPHGFLLASSLGWIVLGAGTNCCSSPTWQAFWPRARLILTNNPFKQTPFRGVA